MELKEMIHVASYAGKIMLESGAETYRVEETINRICTMYGAEEADSFATPTVIIVSIVNNGDTISLVKRISSRTVDLNKVHKINDLSRNILNRNIKPNELRLELEKIDKEERYSFWKTVLFSALGAFGFVFLFQGSFMDAVAAFLIGLIIKIVTIKAEKIKINSFFVNSIAAAILALLAIILINIGLAEDIDKVIIGSIMLLVPGLAITNAIRDTVAGDLVSGIARATEAVIVAVAIAIGTGAVLSFWSKLFGGIIIC